MTSIKRLLLPVIIGLVALMMPPIVRSQTVAVTGTITDTQSTPYSNGLLTVTFVNATGQLATFGGNPSFQKSYAIYLDANGAFTVNLPPNSTASPSIQPSGTQWNFSYQSQGGYGAANINVTITGAGSISGTLSNLARITWPYGNIPPPGAAGQSIVFVSATTLGWGTTGSSFPGCTSPGTGAITCTGTVTANIASVNSFGTNFIDDACGAQAVGNASQNRISCNGSNLPVDSVNGGVAQIIALNLCGSEPAPGAYTPTNTAGITECLQNGTYTVASLQTISANNVTIFCPSKATIIQRTGATGLIKFTGNYDRIVGCTLDGNSQSGAGTGPLIEMTGNDDVAEDMAVTNPGITNTASATILISNGSRNKVKYITFPAATDFTVSIHPAGTNVINDPLIDHVTMNCNPTTVVNCIDLNQASGTIINATVSWNTVYTGGTANDASAYFVAYTLPATNTSVGTRIDHNIAIATVNTNYLFHVFGIFGGSITNNLADDGGVTVQHDMYSLGDAYRSTISGNICNSSAGIQNCFNLADFGNDVISGNTARGIGNNGFGFQSDNEGSGARNSIFSNNTVILAAASDCFRIVNSNAGSSTADDIWVGNTCTGNSGAGENGFNFTAPAGTAANVSIRDNHLALLAGTGIIIGAGVTNTTISGTTFDAVTTQISDSGTATKVDSTLCSNVTPVTVTANVATDQLLMACTLQPGALNNLKRGIRITLADVYTTPGANLSTLNTKVKFCTVSGCGSGTVITPITITSSANPGTVTNNSINGQFVITTQTIGASSAYEAHGNVVVDLGASPGLADSTFSDTNTATVGTIDATAQLFVQITGAFSVASGSNSRTERQLLIEAVN